MEGIVWGSEARSLPGGLFIPWSGVFTKILSRTPLHCRFKCATLAQSIYFLFSRPVRPSGDSYSFQKIYAFPLLKFEKQEISSSPAKGGQMNSMNDLVQAPARLPKPRRDYKDTLFRLLFQDRDRLLSLYNAVNGTSYDSPEDLTVVTLENAVYMNMKNDVAFLPDLKRVYALCGTGAAPCKDYGGRGGSTPGCHRMHPRGDPFGLPLPKQSGGDRSEYI